MLVYKWQLLPIFYGQQWTLSPGHISCYLAPGLPYPMVQTIPKFVFSNEDCRVLYCETSSPSSYPVLSLSHQVHLSYTINTVIQVTFIHTIIHSCINTFTYSYFHSYTTYTQQHSCMVAFVIQNFVLSLQV